MTTKDRQLNMAINPCLHEQIYPNSKGEDFSRNQIQVISGTKYKLKEALKRNTSLKEPNAGYLSSKPNIAHFRKSFFIVEYNKNNKQCAMVFRKHIYSRASSHRIVLFLGFHQYHWDMSLEFYVNKL